MESLALEVFAALMSRQDGSLLCYGAKCQLSETFVQVESSKEAVEILRVVLLFFRALLVQRRGHGVVARGTDKEDARRLSQAYDMVVLRGKAKYFGS